MLRVKVNPSRLEVMGAIKVYEEWYKAKLEEEGLDSLPVDTLFWNGQNLVSEEACNNNISVFGYEILVTWYENDYIKVEFMDEEENIIEEFEV